MRPCIPKSKPLAINNCQPRTAASSASKYVVCLSIQKCKPSFNYSYRRQLGGQQVVEHKEQQPVCAP